MKHFFALLFFVPQLLFAQQKFDLQKLKYPKKYGVEIATQLNEKRVYEYRVPKGKHAVYLPNGLRSANFIDPNIYLRKKDSIFPYRVDIVYSRYPVIDSVYKEFYGLLCNRLIRTFEMDPDLNTEDILFNKVLQTHCETDEQVNTLFHGVVIWYRTTAEELASRKTDSTAQIDEDAAPKKTDEKSVQGTYKDYLSAIETAKESVDLNDSIRGALSGKPVDVQQQIIKKHLEQEITKQNNTPLMQRSPAEIQMYKKQINEFLKFNPFSDSVVWKVMDRHRNWQNAIVINDWTGSMYGYGAQIVHWHINNYKQSGIKRITLFNDGDKKTQFDKVIGETGGIYSSDASDIPKIMNLFNLVRINGHGGDRPENDVEALIQAIKEYPEANEVILIADNYACIRDIEMVEKVTKPIRILVCGYIKELGINPHLIYLAKATGGSLHTLENDFEEIKVEIDEKGEITSFHDKRFVVSLMNCTPFNPADVKFGKEAFKVFTDLDSALLFPKQVRKLALKQQGYDKFPKDILKLKNIYDINLSGNKINKIPSNIKRLSQLKSIDFSNNQLSSLPKSVLQIKGLEAINLSHNSLKDLSEFYPSMYYVKTLFVANNQLTKIEGINQLKNAKALDFSGNQIKEVPIEINQLKSLLVLDLSGNQLYSLPKSIVGLNKLEELNLENNQLGSLPPYLYRLRKLKVLKLAGNPLSEREKDRIRKELPLVMVSF